MREDLNLALCSFILSVQPNAAEGTFIRGLRVSPLRQYFVLMLKDKPFEVWDIASLSMIALLKASQVTALDWCPSQQTTTTNSTGAHLLLDSLSLSR
jgi:WD40 repeat protein